MIPVSELHPCDLRRRLFERHRRDHRQVPLRRMADADEVSSLVLFLASDDSSHISGTEHVIDGALIA